MNNVSLVGRLTREPEVKYNQAETPLAIARFGIAVDRKFKKEGQQEADFPSIVAFGKTAEFVEKYFTKGMRIGIVGRIQTGSYTNKEGVKIYTTEVLAENVEFVESKGGSAPKSDDSDFMNIPDGIDEDLPFN